jgi:hypothetical protein
MVMVFISFFLMYEYIFVWMNVYTYACKYKRMHQSYIGSMTSVDDIEGATMGETTVEISNSGTCIYISIFISIYL